MAAVKEPYSFETYFYSFESKLYAMKYNLFDRKTCFQTVADEI